jgi:hypothetical protein
MLRRKPAMLVVCLALCLSIMALAAASWVRADYFTDNPNTAQAMVQSTPGKLKTKVVAKVKGPAAFPACAYWSGQPKVTAGGPSSTVPYGVGVQFADDGPPTLSMGKWEINGGVIFARLRGKIAWPRYPWWGWGGGWWGWTNEADFTDDLQLPAHQAVPTWSIAYQFRPNWGIRYSGLALVANGGGQPSNYFMFGPSQNYGYIGYGMGIQSKYEHAYHRVGLLYDAVKSPRACASLFADWVHAEDRISVFSSSYAGQVSVFSKGTDAAVTGIEFRRNMKTTANGATLSCECKAGAIFLDDVEGCDIQGAARYSIPMNCGRSGYVKGGYRLVELKKGQNDFLLQAAVEGGFMEFGFVF